MPNCILCKDLFGLTQTHGDEPCPVRESWFCDRCGNKGHRSKDCDEINHVDRPATFEDLIRRLGGDAELERWGLTHTATPLPTRELTLEVAEREIAATNTIDVVYREGTKDRRIRDIMGLNKIKTGKSMDTNLLLLRNWAVRHGKKVRLIQEK
jgi:hypothetical protein